MFVQLKVFEHCQSVLAIYIYDDDKARDVPCTFKLVLNVRRTFSRNELGFQQCSANCLLCNCMLALALCHWAESQRSRLGSTFVLDCFYRLDLEQH